MSLKELVNKTSRFCKKNKVDFVQNVWKAK